MTSFEVVTVAGMILLGLAIVALIVFDNWIDRKGTR